MEDHISKPEKSFSKRRIVKHGILFAIETCISAAMASELAASSQTTWDHPPKYQGVFPT